MTTIATDSIKEPSIISTEKFSKKNTYNGNTLDEAIDASSLEKAATIKGNGGNDIITGSSLNDKLYGGSGDDTLNGGNGNDKIYGESGNDTINGNAGDDIITGGTGTNTIIFDSNYGNDTINLTKGENLILQYAKDINKFEIKGNNVVITNNDGTITLKNFAKKDIIGSKGSIYFNDLNLKDAVYNSSLQVANKKSYSGKWLNEIIDASENTRKISINGGGGNDIITGTNYNDTLKGGSGDDIIEGGKGNDKLYGGTGNNTFVFKKDSGKDTIYSNKGNDTIKLDGIKSSDIVVSQAKNNLVLAYEFDKNGNVLSSVTIKNYFKTNKQGNLTSSVKKILCDDKTILIDGKGSGYIKTDDSDNLIYGNAGNDSIICGSGNDVIEGGKGDDIIAGGGGENTYLYTNNNFGHDTLILTGKKDTIKFAEDADVSYSFEGENLIFTVNKNNTITVQNFVKDCCANENLYFQIGNKEEIKITGQNFNVEGSGIINGSDLNETITGSDLSDIISGNKGDDTIYGCGGENTYLYTNTNFGHDTLILTGEKDTISFSSDIFLTYTLKDNDAIITFDDNNTITIKDFMKDGFPNDNVFIKFGNDEPKKLSDKNFNLSGEIKIDGTELNDTITGSNYADQINGKGGNDIIYGKGGNDIIFGESGDDIIYGGDDNDFIWGYGGNDTIYGENGDDYIDGEEGKNTIYGGEGNDTIYGGAGEDFLNGGTGNDTYIIDALNNGNSVIISDVSGNDKVIVNDSFNNLNIFFDIKNDGTFNTSESIHIINDNWIDDWQRNITNTNNTIKIDCTQKESNGNSEFCPIEEIHTSDNYYITATELNSLRENIASWLTNNNYQDVSSVLQTGKQDDITSLISEFQNIDWQKGTSQVVQ